jgi:hypothetical protein
VATSKPRVQRWSDLQFFFSWESVLVVIGTAVFAALELNLIPRTNPLSDWVNDWKIPIVIFAIALILFPPVIAKGFLHLATLDGNVKTSAELSAALTAIQSRTSNLVSKVHELGDGTITNAYLHHSLRSCQAYFEARRVVAGQPIDHTGVYVEVVYYELTIRPGGSKLERKASTSDDPLALKGTISTRGNAKAKKMVEDIARGDTVWVPNLGDKLAAEALGITKDNAAKHMRALGVPVLSSRRDGADVLGMLLVTSSNEASLLPADDKLIKNYAWFLSVSVALDNFGAQPGSALSRGARV